MAIFTSHVSEALTEVDAAINRAAEIIGGMAESYAKGLAPVDTGLLRNSITHGIEGMSPSISQYTNNTGTVTGYYEGAIPKSGGSGSGITVVIGTNVRYAPYQELGAPNTGVPAHPYMRPAMESHVPEYQSVLEGELSKV